MTCSMRGTASCVGPGAQTQKQGGKSAGSELCPPPPPLPCGMEVGSGGHRASSQVTMHSANSRGPRNCPPQTQPGTAHRAHHGPWLLSSPQSWAPSETIPRHKPRVLVGSGEMLLVGTENGTHHRPQSGRQKRPVNTAHQRMEHITGPRAAARSGQSTRLTKEGPQK